MVNMMASASDTIYEKLCEYEKSIQGSDAHGSNNKAAENGSAQYEIKNGVLQAKVKAYKKPPTRRSRCFDIVTYIPVAEVHDFLCSEDFVNHFAYCLHDKDKYVDDETKEVRAKEKHVHIVLYTKSQHTSSAIVKIFDRFARSLVGEGEQYENTRCIYCDEPVDRYRYLLHLDEKPDPLVHRYTLNDRVTDDYKYWSRLEKSNGMNDSNKNVGLEMVNDYISGMSLYDLLEKYGYKMIQQRKSIADYATRVCIEKGWPLPSSNVNRGDRIGDDFVKWILDTSHYTEQEKGNFYMIWSYIQRESVCIYGSALDIYLQERN